MMTRFKATFLFLLTAVFATFVGATTAATERPNVLVILVDDMGYSDLGCYGGEISTPNIDRLAEAGLRTARFYNGAQCCPTRASLLSGLYPHEAGMGDMNARGPENPFWQAVGSEAYLGFRREGIAILPEVLREGGYQTYISGKWHVGDTPDNWPSARGFERSFSLITGAHEHFTGRYAWREHGPIATTILDGEKVESLPDDFYSTDAFTDYALQFIGEGDPEAPWFLYLAYTAPHWPFQAHPEDAAKYDEVYQQHPESLRRACFARQKAMGLVPESAVLPPLPPAINAEAIEGNREFHDRSTRHYAGMIECVDRNVGRILEALAARGELENTLILFLSDNGADEVRGPLWGMLSNAPFNRHKVWTYEGGIATPLVIHWPAAIPESARGRILGGYGHVIDLQPTILEAAGIQQPEIWEGVKVEPLSGISLLSALRSGSDLPSDRPLFWERQGNEAVRLGDWKLVRGYNPSDPAGKAIGIGPRTGEWELYNLAVDPGETRNLIGQFPEKARELNELFQEWADAVGVIPREEIAARIAGNEK